MIWRMEVRPLRPDDRSRWDPLWAGYLEFYEQSLAPAVTDDVFGRLASDDAELHGLVATDGDELLGFAHVVVHASTWSIGRYVYLEDLFVAPAARGRGIGKALIEAVYALAGDRHVHWHTQATNTTARALYDRVATDSGFVVYER